ncbi:MAG: MFS transporter [Promethearchaeota archaeon]
MSINSDQEEISISTSSKRNKNIVPWNLKIGYALGEIPDMIAYQGFSFLIFTFYSVVVQVPIQTITTVYILWSIYNAFNDPVLGAFSDKTRTKKIGGGRRRPWIVSMILPLPAVMVFLFTPPLGSTIVTAIYMFAIMILFDTFYTTYSLNHTSLYPEMFSTDKEREEVGTARRIIMVVGLLIAFALPGVVIKNLTGTDIVTRNQYILCGGIFGVLILIFMFIHIKMGIREPPLEHMEKRQVFSLRESFKTTIKDRDFMFLVLASTMNWYVFGILPMIIPIYGNAVLGLDRGSFQISLLLVIAFLASIPGVLLWTKIDAKVGSRNGLMLTMIFWALSLLPLLFIRSYIGCAIDMVFVGMGLGGSPYFLDRNISNIVDQDELKTKQRREASFYGIHAIFIRLGAILVILSVNVVFSYNGWQVVDLTNPTEGQQQGLRLLMSVFPAGALLIGLIFLKFFRLNKSKVAEIQEKKKHIFL